MGIQINGNTNNINAGIGSLSIEDINELDIVGVATAANFKTGVSNLHNVGLTLTGGQIDVGSNIKIGTAGVVTATSFVGSGANLTGISAGTSLSGSTNNTVCTVTGANAIQGEANLTYDGTTLKIGGDSGVTGTWGLEVYNTDTSNNLGKAVFAGNQGAEIKLQDTVSGETVRIAANGQASFYSEKAGDPMVFYTKPTGGSNTAGLRITSDGIIETGTAIGDSAYDGNQRLRVGRTGDCSISIRANGSTTAATGLDFGDDDDDRAGRIQYVHNGNYMSFHTNGAGTGSANEQLRITSAGKIGIGDNAPTSDLSIKSSAPGILLTDTSGTNTYGNIDYDSNVLMITSRNNTSPADISFRGYDGTNIKTYMNLTPTGNVVTYNNHLSGTSGHQLTSWYGDDANHYTLEHKDFNEIRAIKTLNTDTYSSIVYKREMMTEYCDIEFTLKGNAPSGTNRHTMFVINGDGSDTFSNYDRLVFRYRPGDTSGNQIRLDKGGGGTGFSEISSSVPNFFDGNERHVHIQIRKRTFSITVNRMGQSEYNYNARNSADLVSPRGYFGFSLYERASHGTPELTIRDFKITNYTQNAIPSTSVAFQATHSGNPGKSSGYFVKPCNVEIFDNGYGGNYNTSNYRFTAPVAGIYQFGNTFNCYSSPSNMFCAIRVNGSSMYIGNKRNNNTGNGDQNVTVHCIVQLQPGDYVEALDNTSNGVTYSSGATWNRFEGSLVAAFK